MEINRLGTAAVLIGALCLIVTLYNTDAGDIVFEEKSPKNKASHSKSTTKAKSRFSQRSVHNARITAKAAKAAHGAETTAAKAAGAAYHQLIRSDPSSEKLFKARVKKASVSKRPVRHTRIKVPKPPTKAKTNKKWQKKTDKSEADFHKRQKELSELLKKQERQEMKAQAEHSSRTQAAFKALDRQVNGATADDKIKTALLQKLQTRFTAKEVKRSEKTAKAAAKAYHALSASEKAAELGRAESAVVYHGKPLKQVKKAGKKAGKKAAKKRVDKKAVKKAVKKMAAKNTQRHKEQQSKAHKAVQIAAQKAVKKAEQETKKVGAQGGISNAKGVARKTVKAAAKKLKSE